MNKYLLIIFFLWQIQTVNAQLRAYQHPNYKEVQEKLKNRWGNFNTRNMLSFSRLPEGLEINLKFKVQGINWSGYINNITVNQGNKGNSWDNPQVLPKANTYDGSYSRLELRWADLKAQIETATDSSDFFILVTPQINATKMQTIVMAAEVGILWNKTGYITRKNDEEIVAQFKRYNISIFQAGTPSKDVFIDSNNPFFALNMNEPVGICTNKQRSLAQIQEIVKAKRQEYEKNTNIFPNSDLVEAFRATRTCLAYNTIYDTKYDRVFSTVSRNWNVNRGGYSFFGWDNFFLAYLTALESRELAYANVIEHLRDMTEEGFIPNNSQGNGRQSWDRSQPPVGAIMVKEIYKKYPEKWFIAAVFDELYTWNRWWLKRRMHKGMLCYGSHPAKNLFNDGNQNTHHGAALESGLDDSPMYEGVPFDTTLHLLLLHDVGLNSLYIADCEALAEIANLIGRTTEAQQLIETATTLKKSIPTLWDAKSGIFLNKRTDNGQFVRRISPTSFYPFITGMVSKEQGQTMLKEYFYHPDEFWGEWILPSISRSDITFEQQAYWKGAVWAPLNFLTYLSLRKAGQTQAMHDLSRKSLNLFVKEWQEHNFVSENYSAESGTGDDPKINSDRFYAWGALMGVQALIEAGAMPATETALIPLQTEIPKNKKSKKN